MAKSFSNPTFYNSGKSAFGNTINTDDSGNYTRNKKAKLLYRYNFNGFNFGGVLGSQNNYLLFQRGKIIRNEICASCPDLTSFNSSDLVAGLYTNEKLGGTTDGVKWGVNVVTDATFNEGPPCIFTPTYIQGSSVYPKNATTPFYWKYKIDPCGSLFGNAPCGYDNYEDYRVISKPIATTVASLKDCCVATCLTENILQEGLCNEVCLKFSYTVTGNPNISIINGFTVMTFTSSGSFTFSGLGKNIGYIVVGGGGAGGGSMDNSGAGGSGGNYSNPSYITKNTQYISAGTYNVTVGAGGAGSNIDGGYGGDSRISGITLAIAFGGAGGKANGFQVSQYNQMLVPLNSIKISIPDININMNITPGASANGVYTNAINRTNQNSTIAYNGKNAVSYGSGGNGANAVSVNVSPLMATPVYYSYSGGNGGPGVVIIWFLN